MIYKVALHPVLWIAYDYILGTIGLTSVCPTGLYIYMLRELGMLCFLTIISLSFIQHTLVFKKYLLNEWKHEYLFFFLKADE